MNDSHSVLGSAIDKHWMRHALALAHIAAAVDEVPVGAVLVSNDNRLLGQGYNQPISTNDPTAHAEIVALRDAAQLQQNYRLPDSTLYVTLEPCTMCIGALIHARVTKLVFATTEPKAGVAVSQMRLVSQSFYNHQMQVEQGALTNESRQLLKQFFARKR